MTRTEISPAARAHALTEKCGYAAAALTLLPIPGSEVLGVMPIHVGMVVRLGEIYGVDVDRDTATHLILRVGATVGLSLLGSRVATTAAKFLLPGLGGLIAAPFMYGSTVAIGRVAQAYFANGGLGDDEMRAIYQESLKKARKAFDPRKARGTEAKSSAQAAVATGRSEDPAAKLERLKRMHEQGLIDDEELAEARQQILAQL